MCRAVVFLFGNKWKFNEGEPSTLVPADGMRGKFFVGQASDILPLSAKVTGWVAGRLADEVAALQVRVNVPATYGKELKALSTPPNRMQSSKPLSILWSVRRAEPNQRSCRAA